MRPDLKIEILGNVKTLGVEMGKLMNQYPALIEEFSHWTIQLMTLAERYEETEIYLFKWDLHRALLVRVAWLETLSKRNQAKLLGISESKYKKGVN